MLFFCEEPSLILCFGTTNLLTSEDCLSLLLRSFVTFLTLFLPSFLCTLQFSMFALLRTCAFAVFCFCSISDTHGAGDHQPHWGAELDPPQCICARQQLPQRAQQPHCSRACPHGTGPREAKHVACLLPVSADSIVSSAARHCAYV